jgi:chromosome segregation ATPase
MKVRSGRRWLAAAVILAAAVTVSGQSATPAAPPDDVLKALLVEVRGLRGAMEQMASAGPRVQLLASRLQLQESRINNLLRRLDTLRDRIGEAQQDVTRLQAEEKQLEGVLGEHKQSTSAEAREEGNMATLLIGGVRAKIATATAVLNRHGAEEAQLMSELTAEQGRWSAINQQLDELERALAKR